MNGIAIRRLTTAEEMESSVPLQMAAWNMREGTNVVPSHQLLTAAKYGGLVLGAFDGERLVGISYGFAGLYEGQSILCSHMNGVHPEYRGKGIGYTIKVQQRLHALELGYETMHWTFDPLELVNGNLNMRRLGATSKTYTENYYGEMRDGLNAGLPSDRLVVQWDLRSERVAHALEHGAALFPARTACTEYDGTSLPEGGGPLGLRLPQHFQALKQREPAAALEWRLASRRAFQRAFAAGYRVAGADSDGYILTRE